MINDTSVDHLGTNDEGSDETDESVLTKCPHLRTAGDTPGSARRAETYSVGSLVQEPNGSRMTVVAVGMEFWQFCFLEQLLLYQYLNIDNGCY